MNTNTAFFDTTDSTCISSTVEESLSEWDKPLTAEEHDLPELDEYLDPDELQEVLCDADSNVEGERPTVHFLDTTSSANHESQALIGPDHHPTSAELAAIVHARLQRLASKITYNGEYNGYTDSLTICAIRCGDDELLHALLHITHSDGFVSLGISGVHLAAFLGKASTMKLLRDHGCDINAMCGLGTRPIHIAAEFYNVDVVRVLLESGIDANTLSDDGETAMNFIDMEWGVTEVQTLLEQYGGRRIYH